MVIKYEREREILILIYLSLESFVVRWEEKIAVKMHLKLCPQLVSCDGLSFPLQRVKEFSLKLVGSLSLQETKI